eukprot:212635-Amorphochlora_amoeboformis.AAC.1
MEDVSRPHSDAESRGFPGVPVSMSEFNICNGCCAPSCPPPSGNPLPPSPLASPNKKYYFSDFTVIKGDFTFKFLRETPLVGGETAI